MSDNEDKPWLRNRDCPKGPWNYHHFYHADDECIYCGLSREFVELVRDEIKETHSQSNGDDT